MASPVLPILGPGEAPVARLGKHLVARTRFLADIEALAEQLPDQPYVVNFCIDRYRFTVGWMAAMLRGQITLLPASRDAHAVAALRDDFNPLYVLTDGPPDEDLGPCFPYPALRSAGGSDRVPAFPPQQVAAVLFTSGSTGRPSPSPRRWGRLVASCRSAGTALGLGRYRGAALIGTVPHAHSYGLESTVMLPLQHGLLLTAERPFFPADVAAALEGEAQPGILVTTPVHLRALTEDAIGPGASIRAGFVLSATAPLSAECAARAETLFGARVFEIYGCSEAGQLATRRTLDGPVWRPLDGFRLYTTAQGSWAAGPDEDDVLVADVIEPVEGGFILNGRTADLVNIAGKRSSLSYLTAQLLAIEGVRDGTFLMPEDTGSGTISRLSAVAVAPGLDAATIMGRLRGRIEPAFLPRPLHIIDALPRNELGKLPRAEILRLVGQNTPLRLRIPPDHPAAAGHFPGNPIVPGAVLLDELVRLLGQPEGDGEIEAAKFHHPVRPGDTLEITQTTTKERIRFECRLADSQRLVMSGALRSSFPSR